MLGTIVFIFLIFVILLWIDFSWGQKRNRSIAKKSLFPKRKSTILLFNSGPDLFQDLFSEISKAQKHVHILFFIITNDRFSQQFLELLEKKARSGVEVRLLVDWAGTFRLSRQAIKKIKQSGIHFSYCFTPRFPFLFYNLQKRNHRKITIIDGQIGYMGGLNIGKEYINQDPKFSPWRDYHLKITGEAVQDLQTVFLLDWLSTTKEDLLTQASYFPTLSPGKQEQQILMVDGVGLEETFVQMIHHAQKQILIGTPYFIPSKALFAGLRMALKRGVQLTVIVPKTADHGLVKEASFRYFRTLQSEGANILQFSKGFYHAKVILIDDKECDIGTSNFDKRSLFLNSEINCLMYDTPSIDQAKKCFSLDIKDSEPIQEKAYQSPNFFQWWKEAIAFIMSPFL